MSRLTRYILVVSALALIHVGVWGYVGLYSWDLFVSVFIGLASTLNIYQFIAGIPMTMGKFDIDPAKKDLRLFFVVFSAILFVISYGASIGLIQIT